MLPTQLGLHFWPTFSYVSGFRIDYLSPTVYLLDVFISLYIFTSRESINQFLQKNKNKVIIIGIFIFLNILFSISPLNTIFWILRFLLYLLFVLSLSVNKVKIEEILSPLLISTGMVLLIEVIHLITQGSVGGLTYWLGERTFSVTTPNIAKLELFGREVLRPYSTFSHPNSLAGYLFLIVLLIKKTRLYQRTLPFLIIGIIMTMSKSTILCTIIIFLNIPPFYIYVSALLNTFGLLFIPNKEAIQLPLSISSRVYFVKTAKEVIQRFPIFGVGIGSYLPSLIEVISNKYLSLSTLQPVHNAVILTISEIGVVPSAMSVFLLLKKRIINNKNSKYIAVIILLATFDHYFYTLPQNKLLLLISLLYLV